MIGTVLVDRYKIVSEIGQGGMANVYLAVDEVLKREVAAKILHEHLTRDSELCHRFQQEASIAAKLEHPNIVKIYDYGMHTDGRSYIISEVIRGQNLHKLEVARLKLKQGPFEPPVCAMICEEILKGLLCAHEQNYIHRDVKPDNVMVSREGQIKLTDFGIAKQISSTLTMAGQFLGSPSYSSPEQVRGLELDFRTDLFSTGIILYEALSARLPFPGNSASDVMIKIAEGNYRPLDLVSPGAPKELCEVVDKAMKQDRDERYSSTGAMIADLRTYLERVGVQNSRASLEEYSKNPVQFMRSLRKKEPQQQQQQQHTQILEPVRRTPIPPLPRKSKNTSNPPENQGHSRKISPRTSLKTTIAFYPPSLRKSIEAPQPREGKQTSPIEPIERKNAKAEFRHPKTSSIKERKARLALSSTQRISAPAATRKFSSTQSERNNDPFYVGSFILFASIISVIVLYKTQASPEKQASNAPKNDLQVIAKKSAHIQNTPIPTQPPRALNPTPTIQAELAPTPASVSSKRLTAVQKKPLPTQAPLKSAAPRVPVSLPQPQRPQTTAPLYQSKNRKPVSVAVAPTEKPKVESAEKVAWLTLRTVPADVPVLFNGLEKEPSSRQRSASIFEVSPGRQKITVRSTVVGATKYQGFERELYIESGESKDLGVVRLVPLRKLKLRIAGPGVIVKINGDPYTLKAGSLEIERPEGALAIEAEATNGKKFKREMMLKGDDLTLETSLE